MPHQMITRTIEGLDWLTDTPAVFIHGNFAVYFCESRYTDRRWWSVKTQLHGDLDCAFADRQSAMRHVKSLLNSFDQEYSR